jgi:thiol-disulfide isomerase/thioredoxin
MNRPLLVGAGVVCAATLALGCDPILIPTLSASRAAALDSIGLTSWLDTASSPAEAAPAASLPATYSSLLGAAQWLNTPPLRLQDLRGKVVLVNFWTYSCINSLRPLPYLKAWADRYGARGLVVIGVHAPEFGFEKDANNVRTAIEGLGVNYPVALDNKLSLWRKFGNRGWPGFYFIGGDGRIRRRSLGEGDYDAAERLIQRLLAETGNESTDQSFTAVRGEGAQAAPDWGNLRSPETYLGYANGRSFVSPGGVRLDAPTEYTTPSALLLHQWGLSGRWTIGSEFASLDGAPGGIRYRFHARDLHLVLGVAAENRPVHFRIRIDGSAPGADHGSDADTEGFGTVRESRLYQLVRQSGPVQDRTFEIEFFDPGVRAYSFTFG